MAENILNNRSSFITGFEWCGERIPYPESEVKGDTYPITWADDGELYTSAGDPHWGESTSGLDVEKFSGGPTNYKITKVHPMNDYLGWGGDGPKPSGMICVEGILYLAFQNMLRMKQPPYSLHSQHGSDVQIVFSNNKGAWWIPALNTVAAPMFPGYRFGGPSFIQFGQNNANARDSFVYAVSTDQWDNGSNLRLGRVPADSIMRREAWEWVCAFKPSGEPAWSYELNDAIPVLSLHRYISLPEMVYLAGIERYLLLTWRLHKDFSPDDGTDLLVFKSVFGMSIVEYITRHRVSHAQRLLVLTEAGVLDIALEAGFGSASQFYTAFERLCGQTPTEYRAVLHGIPPRARPYKTGDTA